MNEVIAAADVIRQPFQQREALLLKVLLNFDLECPPPLQPPGDSPTTAGMT
jgi:hypothetical protein